MQNAITKATLCHRNIYQGTGHGSILLIIHHATYKSCHMGTEYCKPNSSNGQIMIDFGGMSMSRTGYKSSTFEMAVG